MKCLVQPRSQAKSSGIKLPEVHGIGKGLYPNVQPEKQIIKPTMVTKTKEVSQLKPRLGQGRADLRHKIKTPIPINKPIVQVIEKQPKVLTTKSPKIQDNIVAIPNYVIPPMKHRGDIHSRKTIQDVSREIPINPDPVYRLPPKSVKTTIPKIPGSLCWILTQNWILIFKTILHFKKV